MSLVEPPELRTITIRGAREHNLKGIDVVLPRDRLVVVTGLSGSGKSSLAFDTLYAEGQRRYVESLSAYARQFLERMEKPDVDAIDGLSPAIAIEQRTTSRNPRSTVGTVTEIHDYLRLLFARIGKPHCPTCGRLIASQTPQQMADRILGYPAESKIQVLAPLARGRKGEFKKELDELKRKGYLRARIDGELHDLDEPLALDKKVAHTIEVIVDRLVVRPGIERRLADSLSTALALADGLVIIVGAPGGDDLLSERFACLEHGTSLPELTPRMFSFNSPYGACPGCDGLGTKLFFDEELVIPDAKRSLAGGAIAPWQRKNEDGTSSYAGVIEGLAKHLRFDAETPWKDLPAKTRKAILHGAGPEEVEFVYRTARSETTYRKAWEGVIPNLESRYRQTESEWVREDVERFMSVRPCAQCNGARLRPESLAVRIAEKSIRDVESLSIGAARRFLAELALEPRDRAVAERIVKEAGERLQFLQDVGIEYLSLDRTAASLSGGEAQRIRLATQIGSALSGVLYVLDEPSIGLHPRDNDRLIRTLVRLRDLGNTVVVVEHDEAMIRAADWVIDMGPGAGQLGGELVAAGTPEEVAANPASLTGQYLSGARSIPVPSERRAPQGRWLSIKRARHNNLKGVDVRIPLGCLTCVTGVSGSGKSSLIIDTLFPALEQRLMGARATIGSVERIDGIEQLDKVIDIDQSPIGRTPRSNPATYTGLFTPIRELFAELPESKVRGWGPGRFSFNIKGGRCEECSGDGIVKIEMHFLPDVYVTCDACHGQRYNRDTLEVTFKGRSIAQILDLTVDEALEVLGAIPAIRTRLETLKQVGLGYVRLGQQATTLSGGEAQRVKLSRELAKRATGRTVYILDEPTTGLHFDDVRKLLEVLTRLVDQGNTVIVIEHNLDVVKSSDWIVDLGPEGGDGGGKLVAAGPPEKVQHVAASHTGRFLRELLTRR
ncbi:MAG: excinuclease ABC subunit UvrA [Deltaproteobacteria bacterium]|nr:excinuclease ABC subunit UvrA [Deltaproteobacteria bacterium]